MTEESHGIFENCSSLISLPDISKWNTSEVTDMSKMFYNCKSLTVLPDISKWNTKNVTNLKKMFYNCTSLISFPDITKWNTDNVKNMKSMFYNCISVPALQDFSKWNPNRNNIKIKNMVKDITSFFPFPSLLKPNYSKYLTKNVILFDKKSSNSKTNFLGFDDDEDLTEEDPKKTIDIREMFDECISLLYIPYLKEK